MKKTFVWGFDDPNTEIIQNLKKSKSIEVVVWVGANDECTLHRNHLYNVSIPSKINNLSSYSIFDNIYKNSYSTFLNMYAKHDAFNKKSVHDHYDIFCIYFNYLYDIFSKNGVELYLLSCIPHTGADFLAYKIAKELNIETIILYQSIIPNRFFFMNNIDNFGNFDDYKILRHDEDYKIQNEHKINLIYMKNIKQYKFGLKYLLRKVINHKYNGSICRYSDGVIWRCLRFRQYKNNLSIAEHDFFDVDCKYVYFPLHLNPELTTSALGGNYGDQLLALERLSNFLPADWKIYVKENPKQTEFMRGKWFFDRLNAIPKVTMVPKNTDTYDLIKNSVFVSTITGTAGWEAITNCKNALVFGNAWYKSLPGVFQFNEELKLDDILNYNINKNINKNHLKHSLDSLISKMGKGVIDPVYIGQVPNFNTNENIHNITRLLEELIQSE